MWRYWLPLTALLALGALLYSGIGRDPSVLPSPLIGKPTPAFELPLLEAPERRIARDDLLGAPYLLNVFASWCATCQLEHPVLKAFADSGQVRIVGLNWKDTPDAAKRWLSRHGNPYALVLVDEVGGVGIDLGVYGTPESFLIDADGVIRWKHVGELTPAIIDRDLKPLLAALDGGPRR